MRLSGIALLAATVSAAALNETIDSPTDAPPQQPAVVNATPDAASAAKSINEAVSAAAAASETTSDLAEQTTIAAATVSAAVGTSANETTAHPGHAHPEQIPHRPHNATSSAAHESKSHKAKQTTDSDSSSSTRSSKTKTKSKGQAEQTGAAAKPTSHKHDDEDRKPTTTSFLDKDAVPGGFVIKGDSGVSAQMMFLGNKDTVYILDKAENNSLQIGNHPAWGTRYDLKTHKATAMEVSSNTFCAGGLHVANGSWAVFGGNQPVTHDGVAVSDKTKNPNGTNPYLNKDGGQAVRVITPCGDDSCQWAENGPNLTMTSKRWYPTVEGLADGSVIVIGGDFNGGYVATKEQNNPTYEYWPKRAAGASGAIPMQFLDDTLPLSLFPLTWLLPSGKLFLQAAKKTILYDMDARQEIPLPDMPYASRVYPASAATAMLPLTPENNYTAELVFCGGSDVDFRNSSDGAPGFNVTSVPADNTCVRIRPDDKQPRYMDDDHLPEGRSMGSLVYLPDGTMWLGNGVQMGTAGYSDRNYSVGQSLGQNPIYTPVIYDPNAAPGAMYHSSAILLADGSVLVSGSNPNPDVTTTGWKTLYSVEKWYPRWYNSPRPNPGPLPKTLTYGGAPWTITYNNASANPDNIKVVVLRTGFSTHGLNFGQRYLELAISTTVNKKKDHITIKVSQMPPNPNLFTPGPAMLFFVVDGVPSEGQEVMIGNGKIGLQPILDATELPPSHPPRTPKKAPSWPVRYSPTQTAEPEDADKTEAPQVNVAVPTNSTTVEAQKSGAAKVASPVMLAVLAVMGAVQWF